MKTRRGFIETVVSFVVSVAVAAVTNRRPPQPSGEIAARPRRLVLSDCNNCLFRAEGSPDDLVSFWAFYQEHLWPNWAGHHRHELVLREQEMVLAAAHKHGQLLFHTFDRPFAEAHRLAIDSMRQYGVLVLDLRTNFQSAQTAGRRGAVWAAGTEGV